MSDRFTVPLFGLDYTSEIPTSALRASGVRFVYRYCSRYSGKVLTPGERARLEAAGIGVCVVFEDYADNALGGYDRGKADAEFAKRWAQGMGMPKGRPMTWAVDEGTIRPDQCDAYAEAWAAVWTKELTSPYGSYAVVSHFANKGYGCWFQTYAWSSNVLDTRTRVHQYSNGHRIAGYEVDFDHAYYADYGQWSYKAQIQDPRHIAWFPDRTFKFGKRHLNEQRVVRRTYGALEHPHKYKLYLQRVLYPEVKVLRDRVWSVANFYNPPAWNDERRLGWRWQQLNHLMHRISRL